MRLKLNVTKYFGAAGHPKTGFRMFHWFSRMQCAELRVQFQPFFLQKNYLFEKLRLEANWSEENCSFD